MSKIQNEYCISVSNLKKQYSKNSAYVVNNIAFNVKYGTVFGFLGPNGAGKTTTLKILTTILGPTSGSVHVFGKDLNKNQLEIKRRIGVVSQNPSFEVNLTVERALDLYGMLWGIGNRKIRKDKVNKILDTFDLESIRNAKNDELSIGQRRRVQIAREFMHEMDLLFLDEPTVGLDPSARRQLLDYIKVHVRSGLTVFFTTHIMEEAEYLCDEIAIIDHGKIIAFDTPTGLKQKYGEAKTIELTFKDTPNKSFIDLLKSTISRKVSKNDDSGNDNSNKNKNSSYIDVIGKHAVTITVNNAEEIISEILQLVSRNGLQIESIAINSPSLEEVFLSIVNDDSGEI
ncbi:MAG TPA: ATP-binding cassette domain-containing protein [Nitrososphaeraceae archaeon]|nr:ATP-binding cassette domain-containing protein [Nitrososphaeraceae archaeon]